MITVNVALFKVKLWSSFFFVQEKFNYLLYIQGKNNTWALWCSIVAVRTYLVKSITFCLTIGTKAIITFHQSSTKIVVNLSGHNIYLKKTIFTKINTFSKPKELLSGKLNPRANRKLGEDKIKYLKQIIFRGN